MRISTRIEKIGDFITNEVGSQVGFRVSRMGRKHQSVLSGSRSGKCSGFYESDLRPTSIPNFRSVVTPSLTLMFHSGSSSEASD